MKNQRFWRIGLFAMGAIFVASIASSHDMSAMNAEGGAIAPNAMGSHMRMMEHHMRMTDLRPATPADEARAHEIVETLRGALKRYQNYRVALAHGMRIFLPGIPQDVYHFTDFAQAGQEYQGRFDLSHPGSLLYTRDASGEYTLVGAMYSAPADTTMDDLDAIVPLSIAQWHVHTNICLPNGLSIDDILRNNVGADRADTPGMLAVSSNPNAVDLNRRYGFLADGRFGFEGKIYDTKDCQTAGGHLVEQAFGWMVHVYPFSGDDLKVAYGMDVPKPITMSSTASR